MGVSGCPPRIEGNMNDIDGGLWILEVGVAIITWLVSPLVEFVFVFVWGLEFVFELE